MSSDKWKTEKDPGNMQPLPRSIGLPGKICITLTPALYGGESLVLLLFIYLFI